MQIKKTYKGVNPGLLYDELRDFILKQGASLGESKLETYALPDDSSSFTTRGTMTFRVKSPSGKDEECIVTHIVGSAGSETKVLLDIDDKLFAPENVAAFEADLDFIFGSYEVKPKPHQER